MVGRGVETTGGDGGEGEDGVKDPRNGSLYWFCFGYELRMENWWIEGSHEDCGRNSIFLTSVGA